jgi:hypothetical protein
MHYCTSLLSFPLLTPINTPYLLMAAMKAAALLLAALLLGPLLGGASLAHAPLWCSILAGACLAALFAHKFRQPLSACCFFSAAFLLLLAAGAPLSAFAIFPQLGCALHLFCRKSSLLRAAVQSCGAKSLDKDILEEVLGPFDGQVLDLLLIRLLLGLGADANPAFYEAAGAPMDRRALVWLLLSEGSAQVDFRPPGTAESALSRAIRHGNFGTARLLIEARAALEEGQPEGAPSSVEGPPLFCCTAGPEAAAKAALARLLLQAGAQVNARHQGLTPLCRAASSGFLDVVAVLLAAPGIQVDAAEEEQGRTPLWIASAKGHLGIVRALLKAGAEAGRMCSGCTPAAAAESSGHTEVAQLLRAAAARQLAEKRRA